MRFLTFTVLLCSSIAMAEEPPSQAHFDYQLFCQGCHGPDGAGGRGVPKIHNSIGYFLGSQEGREYLIRVPGAANAPVNDERLAALMNWTITRFAGDSKPAKWQAYNAAELSEYRNEPLFEVIEYRRKLLAQIANKHDSAQQ